MQHDILHVFNEAIYEKIMDKDETWFIYAPGHAWFIYVVVAADA